MFREPFLVFRAACADCTAPAAALGGDGWFLPLLAMGRAWNLDDTTYTGFSWHVAGDPELLGAARQAMSPSLPVDLDGVEAYLRRARTF